MVGVFHLLELGHVDVFFFFFQAEDGIRDLYVTGVQTCALPIYYLEEADAYADRIILLRHGQIVADGTSSEVKAMAAGRTVRATLANPDQARLSAIPGADSV